MVFHDVHRVVLRKIWIRYRSKLLELRRVTGLSFRAVAHAIANFVIFKDVTYFALGPVIYLVFRQIQHRLSFACTDPK